MDRGFNANLQAKHIVKSQHDDNCDPEKFDQFLYYFNDFQYHPTIEISLTFLKDMCWSQTS